MTGRVAADVTVVIPTVGRPLLRQCLGSIAAADPRPAEVIVVDQSRGGEVAAWVAEVRADGLAARHLPSRRDRHRQCDEPWAGAGHAHRYVAVTHDDCRVAPSWLAALLARLRDGGEAIVTGRVEPAGEGAVPTMVVAAEPTVHTRPRLDGDDLFPPNMAFPRSVLRGWAALDEHRSLRLAGEDNDWAYRALRAGVPIVYEPSSVVAHVAWQPAVGAALDLPPVRPGAGCVLRQASAPRRPVHRPPGRPRPASRIAWLVVLRWCPANRELRALAYGEVTGLLPGLLAGLRNPGLVRLEPVSPNR